MIYFACSIITGILLLVLYHSRLDAVEKKYGIVFYTKDNRAFPRFKDVWNTRKQTENPALKQSILMISFIRILSFIALWSPFLISALI